MTLSRRIAYYEFWGATRTCDKYLPEQIPAGALTHINIAFQGITSDFSITDNNGDLVARISHLKSFHADLRVNVAVGKFLSLR
jgi:GH18 family chitinase